MVSLRADLHRLSEAGSTGGQEHELLESELVAGMRAAVDNVERRAGEDEGGLDAGKVSEVLVEGDTLFRSTSISDGDGDAKDRVRAKLALVGRAVELDQEVVNILLVGDLEPGLDELGRDDGVDVLDGLLDA